MYILKIAEKLREINEDRSELKGIQKSLTLYTVKMAESEVGLQVQHSQSPEWRSPFFPYINYKLVLKSTQNNKAKQTKKQKTKLKMGGNICYFNTWLKVTVPRYFLTFIKTHI